MTIQAEADVASRTISVADASAMLGISSNLAYRLIREDGFPVRVLKIGNVYKIPRAELERYIDGGEAAAS